MNFNNPVPLKRRFSPVPQPESDSGGQQILDVLGYQSSRSWHEIDCRYRTIILAEAGAGKTYEMFTRAKTIESEKRFAFFIRIEDIHSDFNQAFEVGSTEEFEQWISSQDEAWFFLDSVDEARLSDPRVFEKVIRRFANAIRPAQIRAHICISSRPYAWRPRSDRTLIEDCLPFRKPQTKMTDRGSEPDERSVSSESELEIFQLDPLDEDDIRFFAAHRSISEVDDLIAEIERSNVMSLAERPFDLKGIVEKWRTDRALGGRSELMEDSIERRLDETEPNNSILRPLALDKAWDGARMLAAAVILCDEPGIGVPENTHGPTGIQADKVLSGWDPRDIQTLMERAIFNDVIYGSVRFRHRDICEFLAAEWFIKLLENGTARHTVEALIFREQYGENIISPRLRPVLPWLILKDNNILQRTLAIHPQIAMEGGDPACLPLSVRKRILNGIVDGIVGTDKRSVQDNSAIARIAQPDLADETLSLITRHGRHDKAIFFLGRLAWQGKMQNCVLPLLDIAMNPKRGTSVRIAATRAVMSCGTDEHRASLWNSVLTDQAEIPRELLAELLHRTSIDQEGVDHLLTAVAKLPAYDRFKATGLRQALHGYIDRLPTPDSDTTQPIAKLVDGLAGMLDRPPYTEPLHCRISQKYRWLLEPSIHAVERLVAAHADAAMKDGVLELLLNFPSIHDWIGEDYDHYKDKLQQLVPAWPELNDTLFWRRVEIKRSCLEEDGSRLHNFSAVILPDHYWSFGSDSFPRVLDWLTTRDLEDDRLVALSLAYQIFTNAEKPEKMLHQLRTAVKDDTSLAEQLENLLNPMMSEQESEWQQQKRQQNQIYRHQRLKEKSRLERIDYLKANPDHILHPHGLSAGEISNNHYWLMLEIENSALRTKRSKASNWESLIDEFGTEVAHAYRDAAMSHWRSYLPGLPSEGANSHSIPCSLTFAIAGLEIEAREHNDFPTHLSESEIHHALRYITWETNGFPSWLETMCRTNPKAVMEAIQTEMHWELNHTKPNQTANRLLHNLAHYAPWLHQVLIEPLMEWLQENEPTNADIQRYCLHILKSGGVCPDELGTLAKKKVAAGTCDDFLSQWYAIWVDAQPDTGIPALSKWLLELGAERDTYFAQLFITALMGNLYRSETGPNIDRFRIPKHLKDLYVLMHQYIRVEEDIDRANQGVYSPELRDHAQDARGRIFNLLSEIPGKETHVALMELINEHPNPNCRSWMKQLAYRRAEEDGDLEPWTAAQVHEFDSHHKRTPATQRQLFDLTVACLTNMKGWLEDGDNSPYVTWQRATRYCRHKKGRIWYHSWKTFSQGRLP